MSTSLVLSLQRELLFRNYYVLPEKRSQALILMEEGSSAGNSDHYTVFHSWEDALKELNKFEGDIAAGKRWWSYCPGWMYFNPAFIHQGLKHLFAKFIVESLYEVAESDFVIEEKERFNVWVESCGPKPALKLLN